MMHWFANKNENKETEMVESQKKIIKQKLRKKGTINRGLTMIYTWAIFFLTLLIQIKFNIVFHGLVCCKFSDDTRKPSMWYEIAKFILC